MPTKSKVKSTRTYREIRNATILCLVGRGKSVLTDIIKRSAGGYTQNVYYGYEEANKETAYIKGESDDGVVSFIHLQQVEDFLKLPIGLRRQAVLFKLDF